jgi:putative FmdB family regulatory protein
MPTYDYQCEKCGHNLEAFHKISDPPLKRCEKCGQDTLIRRPGGGIGLAFSGDGFYSTMYGSKPSTNSQGGCCPCGSKDKCH